MYCITYLTMNLTKDEGYNNNNTGHDCNNMDECTCTEEYWNLIACFCLGWGVLREMQHSGVRCRPDRKTKLLRKTKTHTQNTQTHTKIRTHVHTQTHTQTHVNIKIHILGEQNGVI